MALLEGKVAVVTGGGRGLGRAHALALAAAGAKVLVNDVGGADEVAAEIATAGGEAAADHTDLATMASARQVVDAAIRAFGTIDILVNNAGISRRQSLDELDESV